MRSINQASLKKSAQEEIKKVRIGWQLATEEGLATIGNHIHYKCDLFYIPALLYYSVCLAQENSFWDTFKSLQKYISDFDDCWVTTLRIKRGMTDTSKPGAFCKDQATFDGSMRILEQRDSINFPALYAGKVSLETYNLSSKVLIEAAKSDDYVCPPHIRGKKLDFFKKRVEQIWKTHQDLLSTKTVCNGAIRPNISFFGEGMTPQF